MSIDPLAVYRADETAAIFRISLRRLRQLVKAGRLRPQGYCRQHLFFGRDLIAFLEEEGRGRPTCAPAVRSQPVEVAS